MKLAKTNHEEIDDLFNILNEIEWLHKELKQTDFDDVDFSDFDVLRTFNRHNTDVFLTDLVNRLSSIHFQRILWNCRTLLDNCADPNLSTLDFNPDIKAGLDLLEKQKASVVIAE